MIKEFRQASNQEILNIQKFLQLVCSMEAIERFSRHPNTHKVSNTATHTLQLTFLCWYLITTKKISLDIGKVLSYALVHDIVEVYSGDTPAYDAEGQKEKSQREAQGLKELFSDYDFVPDLRTVIECYEEKSDVEARFVYAVDKLVDPLLVSMEMKLSHWKEFGITYEDMRTYKDKKVAIHEEAEAIWKKLYVELESDKQFFFA